MSKSLKLLLVEDSETDALLVVEQLRRNGYAVDWRRVQGETELKAALAAQPWDAVIADQSLPQYNASAALNCLKGTGKDIPFIIVSGTIGEEKAVAAMKAGAHDYIMKDSLGRLAPALERELRDAEVRRQRHQERQRYEKDLQNSQKQLRALATKQESVREEERKRVTRDIHDELGQSLTGFKMDLAWIRNRLQGESKVEILDKIKEMGALIDGTADLIRKLCTELRPGILDDLGLLAAAEWQAKEFSKRTGIACHFSGDAEGLALDSERATAVFRIFQEILTNVSRHAQATEVRVELKTRGKELTLEAKDNGRGIEEKELDGEGSLGLVGMRERALALGGTIHFHGQPSRGTTVTLTIPLTNGNGKHAVATRK